MATLGGIGRSIALQLADEGYNVAVNYAGSKDKADAVVEEIKAKGVDSFAIQANVANGSRLHCILHQPIVVQYFDLYLLMLLLLMRF